MKACPGCKKTDNVHRSHSRGFWERAVLPLILLRVFRCSHCESRFYRFSLRNGHRQRAGRKGQEESAAVPDAEPSQETLDFEQLVRDIHAAEENNGLSRSSSPEDK